MKALFLSLLCAFFLLTLVTVEAADFEITSGSELSFGGSSSHKQEFFTKGITIKNNFPDSKLESLAYTFTPKNDFRQSGFEINDTPSTLDNNTQVTVTVVIKPEDFDAVDNALKKRGSVEIGTFFLTARAVNLSGENNPGNVQTSQVAVKLELKNDLDLISVEYKREEGSFSSISADATVTIAIDEDIDLKFKVKNTFESSSGIALENINIKIESTDLDIEKTTTISEILAGKEAEKTTTVSADDTGSGEVKVSVSGDDKYGGKHGEVFIFNFKVEEAEEEEAVDENDSDGDGVPDNRDECLNTVSVCDVDAVGCPVDSDNDGTCDALDPTPRPARQTNENEEELRSGSENEELEEATTKTKKETADEDDGTSGFIPFLIGFAVGILVTAGFSVLIKS